MEAWQNRGITLAFIPPLLNRAISSRFNATTLMADIVKEGMIEKIDSSVSYASFIVACEPLYCTYTVVERRNILALISTVLAIFSGLNTGITLVISLYIKYVYQFFTTVHGTYLILIVKHIRS